MRIAQVAPLWTPVPPGEYGGAELMVHWLTEELIRRGHEVTLFASGNSVSSAALRPVSDVSLIEAMGLGTAYTYEPYVVSALSEAVEKGHNFDVIHSHIGPLGIPLGQLSDVPMVHTVHQGLDSVDELWLLRRHERATIAAISDSQVRKVGEARRDRIRTVYHGLPVLDYPPSQGGDYLLFLGRMGPQKNPSGAIRIAQQVGMPIVLVGEPQGGGEREYFVEEVMPLLGIDGVDFRGAVSQAEKIELIRGAAALLFPIRWDEHFGLVMIEAMACGTPVVAMRRGSVPEVVEPGVTGYIGASEAELSELVPWALKLDRARVAARMRERFSVQQMADGYESLYRESVRRFRGRAIEVS